MLLKECSYHHSPCKKLYVNEVKKKFRKIQLENVKKNREQFIRISITQLNESTEKIIFTEMLKSLLLI